jgi:hypothetical protein
MKHVPSTTGPATGSWLENLTALVLVLVMAALGWILLAAFLPSWAETVAIELQVIAILGLLTAALALVSVVSLLPTRK